MKKTFVLPLLLILAGCFFVRSQQSTQPKSLVFTHVTVIDATGASAKPEVVGMMNRARVEFLAGTDVSNPYCFPGFSLHDELALLVDVGLSPMEALQSATLNPARFLGKEKELGTVEKGKIADLVLLEANPLEDIRNTTKINSVVLNGRLLERKALDQLLTEVEAAAKK